MESSFTLLLVFVLTSVVNARPALSDASPLQLIAQAIGFYNGESHSDVLFKLYKDEYEYKVGPQGHKQANFTIKETVCQKSDNQTTEGCDFKCEGLEKSCTASKDDQKNSFVVICTTVSLGKDPISSSLQSARNQEDDVYADQPEDEASYEDHVIIMDENDEVFLREDDKEKSVIDAFLASKAENPDDKLLVSRTTKRKMQSGQFLGRLLCLECFIDILPRK